MKSPYFQENSRLWIALRLNNLPLEALHIEDDAEAPHAVIEKNAVIYANKAAQSAGVNIGMDATTAQLLSDCKIHPRNHSEENHILNNLSAQLYQFTPYLEIYRCKQLPHAGVLLEISSCLVLFSGATNLLDKLFTFVRNQSISFEYGLAHTATGAWLLSFVYYDIQGNENRDVFIERLKQLPIELLHDFPSIVDALQKTGFKCLADLTKQIDAQKISSLKKRFGQNFSEYLCNLFGIEQDFEQSSLFAQPLPHYRPLEIFSNNIQFDYPITQNSQLYYPVESLLQELSHYLRKHQLECQHIEWTLSDIYRNKFLLNVHSDTPESHWQLLYDLTLIQLDTRELPFEVDSLTLRCPRTHAIQNRNQLLSFDQQRKTRSAARSFAITLAKLKARLGDAAIYKLSYSDALLPEETHLTIAVNQTPNQQLPFVHKKSPRPTWLLQSPLTIQERKHGLYWRGKITLLAGPERIHAHWWETPIARDYFIAERQDHVRLWIFFDLHNKTWNLHGIFA